MAKIKKNKTKNPNIHSAIFAVIIIVMFVFLVNPEASQYMKITRERNRISEIVGTNAISENELVAGHEQCIRELEGLENTSRLGEFIVKCDKTDGGKFINYFIVYGMRILVVYLGGHTIFQILLLGAYFFRKARVARAKSNPHDQ